MKQLLPLLLMLHSAPLLAGINLFKDEHGETNWQHLANWTSGTLILILSVVIVNLFITRRRARRANRELDAIRKHLEERVRERTATLDEANQLLTETNRLLEDEIAQHKTTTERLRNSESYIRDILASMPLMLIGIDKDGRVTHWNHRAEEITGIDTDLALGRNLWQTYPQITVTPQQVNEAITANTAVTIKHSQRGQYHFDITIYPLQEQTDGGVVILVDDVTKKVLAENMLVQSDKMASMGELASAMAYDINTPLQAILFDLTTYQHILASDGADTGGEGSAARQEKLQNLIADASEKGQHVAAIISNLQAFARGRSASKQPLNIVDVMEHTLELAGDVLSIPYRLRFSDIRIEKQYEKGLPQVPGYATELQQALLSLFRHACDALGRTQRPHHTPTIRIQLNYFYEALWIKIQHNGVGLAPEEQMRLFEPYVSDSPQADSFDPSRRLSFAYFVVTEQHQGQMAVTSDINSGTTFHIQLQVADGERQDALPAAAQRAH